MSVVVKEMVSHVSMMDGDAALNPQAWEKIKHLVMMMIQENERHQKQLRAEQHVSGGVSQELQDDLND